MQRRVTPTIFAEISPLYFVAGRFDKKNENMKYSIHSHLFADNFDSLMHIPVVRLISSLQDAAARLTPLRMK
jgi:hypothetical protein